MSRFTNSCFAAGTACLMAAAGLRFAPDSPDPAPSLDSIAFASAAAPSRYRAPAPLAAVAPRPSRAIAVPSSYRTRSFHAASPAATPSPLPVYRAGIRRDRSSEELLERAMRELAREVYELKRRGAEEAALREKTVEIPVVEIPEPLEDLPVAKKAEDPLAGLPAVRRRQDIRAEGTAFKPWGFESFRSEWAEFVFRPFTTPGLI